MPQLAQEFEYQYFVPYYSLLCAYKFLCYLVQQVRRRHPKKTASRMQELQVIQVEIAQTAREAAEKRSRRPCPTICHPTAVSDSEATDVDDGRFVETFKLVGRSVCR